MTKDLPDGILTKTEDTYHPHKKYVRLFIGEVLESYYGTYTLEVENDYNTESLTFVFNLQPEGKNLYVKKINLIYSNYICGLLLIGQVMAMRMV
jgi:hypothetical protein